MNDSKTNKNEDKTNNVPLWEKLTLTVNEAAKYSGIGEKKIIELCHIPGCKFILYNGSKRLIKRKEFEEYISMSTVI